MWQNNFRCHWKRSSFFRIRRGWYLAMQLKHQVRLNVKIFLSHLVKMCIIFILLICVGSFHKNIFSILPGFLWTLERHFTPFIITVKYTKLYLRCCATHKLLLLLWVDSRAEKVIVYFLLPLTKDKGIFETLAYACLVKATTHFTNFIIDDDEFLNLTMYEDGRRMTADVI